MWMMMGCSAGDCRNPNIHNNRDLPADYSIRPSNPQPAILLIPKRTSTSNTTEIPVLPFNHHQHQMVRVTSAEPGRSNGGCLYKQPAAAAPSRSSRWNPTPEQLMVLEKLYRSGLKTPTAQQIRQVAVQLRNYGKIEGKNVFYWFQNHRARERQKRRRELMSMYQSDCKQQQQSLTNNTVSGIQDKESAGGLTKLSLEVEHQNKWNLPKCTVLSDQDSSSVLQERMMSMVKSDSSRKLVEQPDLPRPTSSHSNASATFSCAKFLDFHHYYDYDYDCGMALTAPNICKREEVESRETQTLELFPLESENLKGAKDTRLCISKTARTDATANFMADRSILSISLNI